MRVVNMEEFTFRCERCGAPLEVSPETIIAVCPYCGYPNHISGNIKTENIYIVPSLDKERDSPILLEEGREGLRPEKDKG